MSPSDGTSRHGALQGERGTLARAVTANTADPHNVQLGPRVSYGCTDWDAGGEEPHVRHGRLPWYLPDDLDPDQRQFYDKVVTSPRANAARPTPLVDDQGRLNGPFNAMLTNPTIGDAVQAIGGSLRFSGKLPRASFEAIVLIVSVDRRAAYEWYAHAPLALRAGLDEAVLTAIREGRDDELDAALPGAIVQLVRDTLAHQQPSEATVRTVEAEYGSDGVTEIVVTVGFYDLIATLMRTWDSPLPEGADDPFV